LFFSKIFCATMPLIRSPLAARSASFVKRAEAAGYGAIVVTLDTLRLAWRDRDLRHGYLPFLKGEGIGQYTSDPVFRALYPEQVDVPDQAGPLSLMMFTNLGLTWADFEWLRQQTSLPLLVKGGELRAAGNFSAPVGPAWSGARSNRPRNPS